MSRSRLRTVWRAQCVRRARVHCNSPAIWHETMQMARQRQETEAFATNCARRQRIERMLSQGVQAYGLRRARYGGRAKTRLQYVATAVAINVRRVTDWLDGVPPTATRCSPFAALVLAR
jgi:transposase